MQTRNRNTAKQIARNLRRSETVAEKKLWEMLRNKKFMGLKFRRQHIIYYQYDNKERFFIADFYCPERKLIIELDGKIHDFQKKFDEAREDIFRNLNLKILRFKNEEILCNLNQILSKLKSISEH